VVNTKVSASHITCQKTAIVTQDCVKKLWQYTVFGKTVSYEEFQITNCNEHLKTKGLGKNVLFYRGTSLVNCVWNVMAHAQKPDFVFRRNERAHFNRLGRQFSRLLAAEVCASALVMLDTPCSEVVWEYWLPTPFASFPFTSPPVRHRVPSHFNWTLPFTYLFAGVKDDCIDRMQRV
jgi:hypothetical protein